MSFYSSRRAAWAAVLVTVSLFAGLLAGCAPASAAAAEKPEAQKTEAAPAETETAAETEAAPAAAEAEPVPVVETAGETSSDAAPEGPVRVHTPQELLEAVAPGAEIAVEPGTYDLTGWIETLEDPVRWQEEHPCVVLSDAYDGMEVVIRGADGLTIRGPGGGKAELQAKPRYADVLRFENCSGILLEGLTMGHTVEPGQCAGDVLEFAYCTGAELRDLDLYGCGTYGVSGFQSRDIAVYDSTIRECSYGIVSFSRCGAVRFEDCALINCGGYDMIDGSNSTVEFRRCLFRGNAGELGLVCTWGNNAVSFSGCTFGEWESAAAAQQAGKLPGVVFDADCSFTKAGLAPTAVSDVKGFLEAVAPGAVILLEPGTYDLTAWAKTLSARELRTWNRDHDHVRLDEREDSVEVTILDVDGLVISGTAGRTELTAESPEISVLHFLDCANFSLSGLTMRHTGEGDEDSAGSLLGLDRSSHMILSGLELHGGREAVDTWNCQNLFLYDSTVQDSTQAPLSMMSCSGEFSLRDCVFTGSGEGFDIFASDEAYVSFLRCVFGQAESESLSDRNDVTAEDCQWAEDASAVDFHEQLKLVRFDEEALRDTEWEAVRLLYPSNGEDYSLPMDIDGQEVRFGAAFAADGSGTLDWLDQTEIPFRWEVDKSGYQADLRFGEDYGPGTAWLYVDPALEESPLWLELSLGDEYFIWFLTR